MNDHTRSDIRLGDLSAVDAATETPEPRLSAPDAPTTVAAPVRIATVPAAPARSGMAVPVLGGLIMLLTGVVVFLVLGQRDLQRALAVLDAQNKASVATLADRVSSTSTTLKSADSETQRSLNVLASDIAKLDAGAQRLAKAIDQQARDHAATANELKALAAEMRRTQQSAAQGDAQQEARLKTLTDALDALAVRQKTQADGLARLERNGDVAQLRSEVTLLGDNLREMQTDYDRRLKAGEQATASSDAFRRQVNATIDRLNQQVSELYQRR